MFTTQVYLYKQKHQVVLRDTTQALTSMRYNPVYAKNLKLHKGTDNVLVFTFVNQDQKPVNNSTATFTFRLINREGNDLILAKTMTAIDATKGTASVTVTEQDLDAVDIQKAHYSIERSLSTSDLNDAVFVDDHLGGRGVVEILDSIMPQHTESQTVTIPDFLDSEGETTHYSSEWQGTIINNKHIDLNIVHSTARMNTKDFEVYADQIRIWALYELGIRLMLPNEYE